MLNRMRRVSKTDGYIATDVFDGRALCMTDYIATASECELDRPTFFCDSSKIERRGYARRMEMHIYKLSQSGTACG